MKVPCEICGHSADDHRLDDSLGIGPVDPVAKFRCIAKDCGCVHFVGTFPWEFKDDGWRTKCS